MKSPQRFTCFCSFRGLWVVPHTHLTNPGTPTLPPTTPCAYAQYYALLRRTYSSALLNPRSVAQRCSEAYSTVYCTNAFAAAIMVNVTAFYGCYIHSYVTSQRLSVRSEITILSFLGMSQVG